MSLPLEGRLLVQQGISVFPLRKDSKVPPPGYKWLNGGAASEPSTACDLFVGWDGNYAVRCDKLIVVDPDEYKEGAARLADVGDFPETYTVGTPRGGRHLYYWAPAGRAFASSVGKLAPGVDIKTGPSAYVVGPGSCMGDKAYTVLCRAPIAPCPEWLVNWLSSAPVKAPNAGKGTGQPDTPDAIAHAIAYLETAKGAVEGQEGDDHTIAVANFVLDRVSAEQAFELMWERWNPTCSPPWDYHDLKRKVESAAKSRQRSIGWDRPAGGFEAVTPPVQPPLFTPASRWAGKKPTPDPMIVDMYVPRDYVTIIGAAGGRGKSALALQMMVAVASGTDFLGFKVLPGSAAGFFCEDTENAIHKRTAAICRNLGVDLEKIADRLFPTSFLSSPTELWNERDGATKLLERVETALTTIPGLRLLILDGAADTFSGNENDRGQVTRFMRRLTELAERHGIAIVLIMHESKSTADDDVFAFSGSTAWFNKCRSAIKIARVDDHHDLRRLLHLKGTVGGVTRPAVCRFGDFTYTRLSDELDRAAKCFEVTKELMAKAMAAGKQLSPNKRATNYAGRYLEAAQSGTDFHKDEFALHLEAPTALGLAIEIYSKSGGRRSQRFAAVPVGFGDGSVSVTVGDGQ